jgi:hypothetical protein
MPQLSWWIYVSWIIELSSGSSAAQFGTVLYLICSQNGVLCWLRSGWGSRIRTVYQTIITFVKRIRTAAGARWDASSKTRVRELFWLDPISGLELRQRQRLFKKFYILNNLGCYLLQSLQKVANFVQISLCYLLHLLVDGAMNKGQQVWLSCNPHLSNNN